MFNFNKVELTREEGIKRGRSMEGRGYYKLGAGGVSPFKPTPFNADEECDCSGYVCWAVGMPRKLVIDGEPRWFNTDGIINDATTSQLVFEVVPKTQVVRAGDLVVYGSTYVDGDRTPGHVEFITSGSLTPDQRHDTEYKRAGKTYMTFNPTRLLCTHCAPRRGKWPFAIRREQPVIPAFRTRGYIVRYKHWATAVSVVQAAAVPPALPPVEAESPEGLVVRNLLDNLIRQGRAPFRHNFQKQEFPGRVPLERIHA